MPINWKEVPERFVLVPPLCNGGLRAGVIGEKMADVQRNLRKRGRRYMFLEPPE